MSKAKEPKVGSVFAYHEERVSGSEIKFGWIKTSSEDLSKPYVVSYGSRSKKATDRDIAWSKEAGVNAASLGDYKRYFSSLTGEPPEPFLDKWGAAPNSLEEHRVAVNPNYRKGEGLFLISLAKLISSGKKFSQYGRVFRLISEET